MHSIKKIKKLLEINLKNLNYKKFIKTDPIQIPYLFKERKDVEISGFLTSIMSWGKRKETIKKIIIINADHEL